METPEDIATRIGLGESPGSQAETGHRKWLRKTPILAAALAITGVGAWKHFDRSGGYEHFLPTVSRSATIDNVENIISWNMAGQAARRHRQIRALAARYSADIIDLQEVDTTDAKRLHHDFPSWHVVYALADQKQHLTEGGYGNVLMSRQKPTNIESRSLPGTSLMDSAVGTVTGMTADVLNLDTNLTATRDGWQERRVALAETTRVVSGNQLEDFRAIDIHISGNTTVHRRQLSESIDFINDNIQDGRPVAACGDFNAQPAEITAAFAKIGMVTATKKGINSSYNGDYCGYYMAKESTTAHVTVLNEFKTDHYPLKFSWSLYGPG